MALLQGFASSIVRRFGITLALRGLVVLFLLLAAACVEEAGEESTVTPGAPVAETPAGGASSVTVYSSPACGCCKQYEAYLQAEGFDVKSVKTEDVAEVKDNLGVPADMQSCHTAIVGEYFVEGHVPVEAIQKLLEEQAEIDGIALPGMPPGSPGMGGVKSAPFIIYSITEGIVDEFMTV